VRLRTAAAFFDKSFKLEDVEIDRLTGAEAETRNGGISNVSIW
jgi:hypothetical protein